MRRTAIIGILALLAVFAMPTASAVTTFYFVPHDGNSSDCSDTVVELWANAPYGINNFQLAVKYDESCIKFVDVDWNSAWWMTTWNETPACFGPGHDWLKAWCLNNIGSGDVKLCDITIRCIDSECDYCKTHMNMTCGVDCSFCGFSTGNASGTIPAAGTDGTFTCGTQETDLIVESVSINPGCKHYYFANEPNVLDVTIKNIGTGTAGPSNASVSGASGVSVAAVGALDPGQSETVTITDTIARPAGEVVTAIADCYNQVTESDETNNASSIIDPDGNDHVINHGCKGKWLAEGYAGPDPGNMTTWKSYELHGNLNYSVGDSYYLSGYNAWEHYTANWTADDLPIPDGATVVEARLYVYYCWDKAYVMPDNVSTEFNDVIQEPEDVHYTDRRGYGSMASFNLPYGAIVYNVTDDFDRNSNYANVTKLCDLANQVSPRGMMLVVVYEDPTEPLRQIFVIEEFDNLYASASYCTSSEEATAWAIFTGPAIDLGTMVHADLITIVNGAGEHDDVYDPTEGDLIFNGQQLLEDAWDYLPGPTTGGGTYGETEIGARDIDVTALLQATGNRVGMRSNDTKYEWIEPSNAILVVTLNYTIGGQTTPAADKVNITNLDNGKEWAASIYGDCYTLTLTPGVDVNATEVLRIIACDVPTDYESNCNATDHTVTSDEINAGGANLDMDLDHYCLNWYPRYPYYTWNEGNLSGPAVMEMCIDNYRDPPYVPDQTELNETGLSNNYGCNSDLLFVDTQGMWTTLNHYLHAWNGQPYVANYGRRITDDRNYALHYICWYQSLGPGAAPAYGDYSNWMAIRGIHTNVSPRTAGYYGYDIYGFWLNDPNPTGIGENTYKSIDQWNDEYFFNLTGINESDPCYGKYVAVCEPPEHDAEVRLVSSKPRLAVAITPVMTEKTLMVYDVEQLVLEKVVKDDESLKIVAAAIDGVNAQLTPYDAEFAATFAKTTAGKPMLATDDRDDYYLVPFNAPLKKKPIKKVPVKIEKVKISGLKELERMKHVDADVVIEPIPIEPISLERTLVVVLVDAEDGSFKEASWVADPVKYLPVSKAEALKIALGEISITAKKDLSSLTSKPTIELVHRDASPYYPDWKITVNDQVFYVNQDGTVSS